MIDKSSNKKAMKTYEYESILGSARFMDDDFASLAEQVVEQSMRLDKMLEEIDEMLDGFSDESTEEDNSSEK